MPQGLDLAAGSEERLSVSASLPVPLAPFCRGLPHTDRSRSSCSRSSGCALLLVSVRVICQRSPVSSARMLACQKEVGWASRTWQLLGHVLKVLVAELVDANERACLGVAYRERESSVSSFCCGLGSQCLSGRVLTDILDPRAFGRLESVCAWQRGEAGLGAACREEGLSRSVGASIPVCAKKANCQHCRFSRSRPSWLLLVL